MPGKEISKGRHGVEANIPIASRAPHPIRPSNSGCIVPRIVLGSSKPGGTVGAARLASGIGERVVVAGMSL